MPSADCRRARPGLLLAAVATACLLLGASAATTSTCTEASCLPPIPAATLSKLTPLAERFGALAKAVVVKWANVAQSVPAILAAGNTMIDAIIAAKLPAPLPPIRPDTEAQKNGYHGEYHPVTTSDGYILGLFRVNSPKCKTFRSVAVVAPGALANAASYMFVGKKNLVYRLADRCHDVWLVSFRGDVFSRSHTRLNVNSKEFWDFYLYHNGAFDLPAQLTEISKRTGSKAMRYVGTDQACLILLFMNHVHGELYQRLLAGAYLMSPMGYLGRFDANISAALAVLTDLFAGKAGAARGEQAFWDPERHAAFFNFCGRVSPDACVSFLQFITGPSAEVDKTHLIDVARNMFDSTSNNTSIYIYTMAGKPKHLTLFDYGAAENQRRYKSATPPALRLDRTTVKCSFFPAGQTNDFKPADALDTFQALAKSAQSHYQVLDKYSSMSPFVPIDTDGIYGVVVARYELELGQQKQ